jgi:hypothetical protein
MAYFGLYDLVKSINQHATRPHPIGYHVLSAIRYPNVHQWPAAELFGEIFSDAQAGQAVVDPEAAHRVVGMGQRAHLRAELVGEPGRIKVKPNPAGLCPCHPVLEMGWRNGVAFDRAGAFEVDGMQIQPMRAGNLGQRHIDVGAQLLGIPGAARVVAAGLNAAAERRGRVLESAHVVALPAVQRDSSALGPLHAAATRRGNSKPTIAAATRLLLNRDSPDRPSRPPGMYISYCRAVGRFSRTIMLPPVCRAVGRFSRTIMLPPVNIPPRNPCWSTKSVSHPRRAAATAAANPAVPPPATTICACICPSLIIVYLPSGYRTSR